MWWSLCSSVVRMKRAEGLGRWVSLWMRLANGVVSDVRPRLMTAMVRSSSKVMAASQGEVLNHWKWMGVCVAAAVVAASR